MINYIRIVYTTCRYHKKLQWSSPLELIFMSILPILLSLCVDGVIDLIVFAPIYFNGHSLPAILIYIMIQINIIVAEIISDAMNQDIYHDLLEECGLY